MLASVKRTRLNPQRCVSLDVPCAVLRLYFRYVRSSSVRYLSYAGHSTAPRHSAVSSDRPCRATYLSDFRLRDLGPKGSKRTVPSIETKGRCALIQRERVYRIMLKDHSQSMLPDDKGSGRKGKQRLVHSRVQRTAMHT